MQVQSALSMSALSLSSVLLQVALLLSVLQQPSPLPTLALYPLALLLQFRPATALSAQRLHENSVLPSVAALRQVAALLPSVAALLPSVAALLPSVAALLPSVAALLSSVAALLPSALPSLVAAALA